MALLQLVSPMFHTPADLGFFVAESESHTPVWSGWVCARLAWGEVFALTTIPDKRCEWARG